MLFFFSAKTLAFKRGLMSLTLRKKEKVDLSMNNVWKLKRNCRVFKEHRKWGSCGWAKKMVSLKEYTNKHLAFGGFKYL